MRLGRKPMFAKRRRYLIFASKNRVFKTIIVLLLVILCHLSVSFILRVRPIIIAFAESKARYLAIAEIERAVYDVLAKEEVSYASLMEITRDEVGAVTSVSASGVNISRIKSIITRQINDNIEKICETRFTVPLGSVTGNELLEGLGPRMSVTAVTTGNVFIDVKSVFEEAGINQTRHEVFFDVKVGMSVIIKGKSFSQEVKTTIPVAQTLIVGDVPDTYTNITEASEKTYDLAGNLIQ